MSKDLTCSKKFKIRSKCSKLSYVRKLCISFKKSVKVKISKQDSFRNLECGGVQNVQKCKMQNSNCNIHIDFATSALKREQERNCVLQLLAYIPYAFSITPRDPTSE